MWSWTIVDGSIFWGMIIHDAINDRGTIIDECINDAGAIIDNNIIGAVDVNCVIIGGWLLEVPSLTMPYDKIVGGTTIQEHADKIGGGTKKKVQLWDWQSS